MDLIKDLADQDICSPVCVNTGTKVVLYEFCLNLTNREGPVVENQEATQIFIKYMHDIVL